MATVALSVFGLGSKIDVAYETLVLAGVIGFTVAFEMAAHRLEHRLAGTPYMGMLAKFYKELMIMGFISLGVFLTLQFGGVGSTVGFYTFEFAHIVVFFTTLIFVMQACLMMVLSSKLKKRYEKSANISVDHLLTFYSLQRKSKLFHARWLPLSDLREVMEFKIVHAFFRTTFALPTTFNFALYMREATDSHILALVDVESSTWVILAGVCFLNLARIKIWQMVSSTQAADYHADDDHATDDHASSSSSHGGDAVTDDDHRRRRWLAGGGEDGDLSGYSNTGADGELMFILSGWLMLALAVGNYFMSRWVELRLLKKAGCDGTHDYSGRLTVIEKQALEAKRLENAKQPGAQDDHLKRLRRQINKAKGSRGPNYKHHHKHHKIHKHHQNLRRLRRVSKSENHTHGTIARHLDQAKRHAQAFSSTFGSSGNTGKKHVEAQRARQLPPRAMFRLGSNGKVVPGSWGQSLQPPSQPSSPFHGLRAVEAPPDAGERSQRGESLPARVDKNSSLAKGEQTSRASSVIVPRASDGALGAGPGTRAGVGAAAGSSGNYTPTMLLFSSEIDKEESESSAESLSSSGSASSNDPLHAQQEGHQGWQEGGEGKEEEDCGYAAAVDEGLEDRIHALSIPTLATRDDSGDTMQQAPLEVVVRRELPSVDEVATAGCDQQVGDKGNDSNSRTTSAESYARRRSTSLSQVATVGRRVSASVIDQVRRASGRVSQSAAWVHTSIANKSKLAINVTSLAGRITRSPSAVPSLNLFNDLSDIYPMGSPMIFHKTLDVLLLLSCTYLALWAVNFSIIANKKSYAALRHMAILLPASGVFLFNALSVKTSSLLLAISAMDPEIIGRVVDEQIDEEKLVVQFRERLTTRLRELGLGQSGLATAFEEVAPAGSGELTVKELSHVLFTLNFHASKDKYQKLFNVMDKNRKGVVSYHQLCELVYNQEAAAQEATALKMKGKMHAIK